jgi:hypothetical protein
MTETLETADEIRRIRDRVDGIEATERLLLTKDAPQVLDFLLKRFDQSGSRFLPAVYLAIDGKRSQTQLVRFLNQNARGASAPTVSRSVRVLRALGLIERVSAGKGGVVWAKTSVDGILGLTKALQKKASTNGRTASNRNK